MGLTLRPDWLNDNTIYYCVHGSHAYGTNIATSDRDYRGIVVPPKPILFGFRNKFEQFQTNEPDDVVIFALDKFCRLAADCNPNVIEQLFVEPEHILSITEGGQLLRSERHRFLSRKIIYSFKGYALGQLNRIKTHRNWLLNPPTKAPERKDFGLGTGTGRIGNGDGPVSDQIKAALSMIQKKVDSWSLDLSEIESSSRIKIAGQVAEWAAEMQYGQFQAAGNLLGFETNFLELLKQEQGYKQAQNNWDQYRNWNRNRNASRFAGEEQFGYDTKNAMHLVRLLTMAEEILTTGEVYVNRERVGDADLLRRIRGGCWSFETLMQWVGAKEEQIKSKQNSSVLPAAPDYEFLDDLAVRITAAEIGCSS